MFRLAACCLIVVMSTILADAEPNYPSWCCPRSCKSTDRTTKIVTTPDGTMQVLQDGQVIPFSENYYRGDTQKNRIQICIGFDAFGNREVKCLFSPLIS